MSGTKAHNKRENEKKQLKIEQVSALNSNRGSILQMTIDELNALYGEENVNVGHPLFVAIQSSANGSLIDLTKLASDIVEFNTPEEV